MAGGVAHDFNNLLVAILGGAELAKLDADEPALVGEHLETIRQASLQARDLCQQLLAYAGAAPSGTSPEDLNAIVAQVRPLLTVAAGAQAVRMELAPDLPPVDIDPAQLKQVLLNLVTNAAEASTGTSAPITVQTGVCDGVAGGPEWFAASAEPELEGRCCFVEVRDEGHGMDDETRVRAFEPFYSTRFAGRGLGLAVVLGAVRMLGGAIALSSRVGGPTRVRVRLPLADGVVAPRPQSAAGDRAWTGPGVILLVDDDPLVRRAASGLLRRLGYGVVVAPGGREALALLDEGAGTFAAVLTDVTMPGMTGLDLRRTVRERWPDLPVLLSTGYSVEPLEDQLAEDPEAAVLQKPYELEELRRLLLALLSRGGASGP